MLLVRNEWWEKRWHHPELIIRGRAVTSLGANPWLNADDVLAFAWLYFFLSFSFVGLGCLSSGMSVCQTNFFLCQEASIFYPFLKNPVFFPSLIIFLTSGKETQTNKKTPTPQFQIWKIMHTLLVVHDGISLVFPLQRFFVFPSTLPPPSHTHPVPSSNLDWGSILSLHWMGRKIIYQKRRAFLL